MKHLRNFGSGKARNLVFCRYKGNISPGKETEKIPKRKTGAEQAVIQDFS